LFINNIEDKINKLAKKVEGTKGADENIIIFTLSTCMWCKKCKRFLNEKNMNYKFIDVDKIEPSERAEIVEYLRENYNSRVAYPFLVCKKGHAVGYDPDKYMELLGGD